MWWLIWTSLLFIFNYIASQIISFWLDSVLELVLVEWISSLAFENTIVWLTFKYLKLMTKLIYLQCTSSFLILLLDVLSLGDLFNHIFIFSFCFHAVYFVWYFNDNFILWFYYFVHLFNSVCHFNYFILYKSILFLIIIIFFVLNFHHLHVFYYELIDILFHLIS